MVKNKYWPLKKPLDYKMNLMGYSKMPNNNHRNPMILVNYKLEYNLLTTIFLQKINLKW